MKSRLTMSLMALSIVVALTLGCATGPKRAPIQGIELGESRSITAEVVAIDKADRTLTLREPRGDVVSLEVSDAARNFDQVKVGDQVNIEYYEAVAVYLGEPGQQPSAVAGTSVVRAAEGETPGGYAVSAVDLLATVEAIDRSNRTVTLRGPEGNTLTTKVDPSVKAFDALEAGDSIHIRFTEAIAISVEQSR
jgi:aminoglycoside phosphotransferase (APT) family kinase protein